MTNLEKIAKVFEELGCDITYDNDNKCIEVRYEMITNRTDHEFIAYFDKDVWNDAEVDLDDIDWGDELEIRFNFEDELDNIEDKFCRYYMKSLLDFKSVCAHNVEFIAREWDDDEIYCIKADFEEFWRSFESLIKKYTKEN